VLTVNPFTKILVAVIMPPTYNPPPMPTPPATTNAPVAVLVAAVLSPTDTAANVTELVVYKS
jgi:hypothetical protein